MEEEQVNQSNLITDKEMIEFEKTYHQKLEDEILNSKVGKKIVLLEKLEIGISVKGILDKYIDEKGITLDKKGHLSVDLSAVEEILKSQAFETRGKLGFDILSLPEDEVKKMAANPRYKEQVIKNGGIAENTAENKENSREKNQLENSGFGDNRNENKEKPLLNRLPASAFDPDFMKSNYMKNAHNLLDTEIKNKSGFYNSPEETEDAILNNALSVLDNEEKINENTDDFLSKLSQEEKRIREQRAKRVFLTDEKDPDLILEIRRLFMDKAQGKKFNISALKKYKDSRFFGELTSPDGLLSKDYIESFYKEFRQERMKYDIENDIVGLTEDTVDKNNPEQMNKIFGMLVAARNIENVDEYSLNCFKKLTTILKNLGYQDFFDPQTGINKELVDNFLLQEFKSGRFGSIGSFDELLEKLNEMYEFNETRAQKAKTEIIDTKENNEDKPQSEITADIAQARVKRGREKSYQSIVVAFHEKRVLRDIIDKNGKITIDPRDMFAILEDLAKAARENDTSHSGDAKKKSLEEYINEAQVLDNPALVAVRNVILRTLTEEQKSEMLDENGKFKTKIDLLSRMRDWKDGERELRRSQIDRIRGRIEKNAQKYMRGINNPEQCLKNVQELLEKFENRKQLIETAEAMNSQELIDEVNKATVDSIYEILDEETTRMLDVETLQKIQKLDEDRFNKEFGKSLAKNQQTSLVNTKSMLFLRGILRTFETFNEATRSFGDKEIRNYYMAKAGNLLLKPVTKTVQKVIGNDDDKYEGPFKPKILSIEAKDILKLTSDSRRFSKVAWKLNFMNLGMASYSLNARGMENITGEAATVVDKDGKTYNIKDADKINKKVRIAKKIKKQLIYKRKEENKIAKKNNKLDKKLEKLGSDAQEVYSRNGNSVEYNHILEDIRRLQGKKRENNEVIEAMQENGKARSRYEKLDESSIPTYKQAKKEYLKSKKEEEKEKRKTKSQKSKNQKNTITQEDNKELKDQQNELNDKGSSERSTLGQFIIKNENSQIENAALGLINESKDGKSNEQEKTSNENEVINNNDGPEL